MKLKEILEYYERYIDMLLEATDYNQMFSKTLIGVLNANSIPVNPPTVIKDAKQKLVRDDRVVWYLRNYKLSLLGKLAKKAPNDENAVRLIEQELKKFNRKANTNHTIATIKQYPNIDQLLTNIQHYLSMGVFKINEYKFEYQQLNEVLKTFDDWEAEHIAAKSSDRLISEQNEKVFLDLGDGWVWFDLNRPYCSVEGKKMGHCGNEPDMKDSNQTILSLRQKVKQGKKIFWQPHATFIYFKNQQKLGQRKGIDNYKPSKQVEPQIVKLLKDPRIKGFNKPTSTHHWAHEDFDIEELDADTKKSLYDVNDSYQTLRYRIAKNGVTDKVLSFLDNMEDVERTKELDALPKNLKDMILEKRPKFMTFKERIEKFGVNQDVIEGLRRMDRDDRKSFIGDLDEEHSKKILEMEPYFMEISDKIAKFGLSNDVLEELAEIDDEERDKVILELSEKDAKRLFRLEPDYKSFEYVVMKEGMDKLLPLLGNNGVIDDENKEYPYVVAEYDGLGDMAEDLSDTTTQNIINNMLGDGDDDYMFQMLDGIDEKYILDNQLSGIQRQIVQDYTNTKYPNEEDDEHDFDYDESIGILDENEDDFYVELKTAARDASMAGIEQEITIAINDAVNDIEHETYDVKAYHGENIFDTKFKINLGAASLIEFYKDHKWDIENADDMVDAISDELLSDYPIKFVIEVPYNGFLDFDEEYFENEIKKPLERMSNET